MVGPHVRGFRLFSLAIAANQRMRTAVSPLSERTRTPSCCCTGVPMNMHAGGSVSHVLSSRTHTHFFHAVVLLIPSPRPELLPCQGCKIVAQRWRHDGKFRTALASRSRGLCPGEDYRFPLTGFVPTWIMFQDTRIALSHSCCTIFVSGLYRMSLF
jgi:hypothetical protein